jgi:hypothetical protein
MGTQSQDDQEVIQISNQYWKNENHYKKNINVKGNVFDTQSFDSPKQKMIRKHFMTSLQV